MTKTLTTEIYSIARHSAHIALKTRRQYDAQHLPLYDAFKRDVETAYNRTVNGERLTAQITDLQAQAQAIRTQADILSRKAHKAVNNGLIRVAKQYNAQIDTLRTQANDLNKQAKEIEQILLNADSDGVDLLQTAFIAILNAFNGCLKTAFMVSLINYRVVLKVGIRAVDSYLKSWRKKQAELQAMQKREQSRRKQSYTIDNAIIEKIDVSDIKKLCVRVFASMSNVTKTEVKVYQKYINNNTNDTLKDLCLLHGVNYERIRYLHKKVITRVANIIEK